jgi:hypothetical protein
MKDEKDKREGQTGAAERNSGKDPRRDRLKLALRENLKRRKSQARGRSDITAAPSAGDDLTPHDVSGKKPGE